MSSKARWRSDLVSGSMLYTNGLTARLLDSNSVKTYSPTLN